METDKMQFMQKTLWKNLKAMMYRYRWRYVKAIIMLILANLLIVSNPLILRQAILSMTSPASLPEGIVGRAAVYLLGPYQHNLWMWVTLLLTVAFSAGFLRYRMRIGFIAISRDSEKDLRSEIFDHMQRQSKTFYDHYGVGELLSRLTNDISAYRDVLGPGVMYPIFFITLAVPGIIALYLISPSMATLALFPLFVLPLTYALFRHKIYSSSKNVQDLLGNLSDLVQEQFSAIRFIKSYAAEKPLFQVFSRLNHSLSDANFQFSIWQSALFPFFTLLTKLSTIVLVLFSAFATLKGWDHLNPADFVSFMWLQSYIFFPIVMLTWVLPIYERGKASYERLFQIYDEPIEVKDQAKESIHIPQKADIVFNNLNFTYPNQTRPALVNFNLTVEGGSFIGITGPIGSGKTTLFRLLNREYEIPFGMIEIGGRDIHEYPLENFNKGLVTVEQAPFLFSRTIAENITFGKQEASLEELELVAHFADLHETVLEFPDQWNTLIGERGVTLSGGQRQRVAMARAFLVNRSILLLDDIFSAVDNATQKRIFNSMVKNFSGKTVLIISHRVSVLEQLDRVVYLMDGKIVEYGSPDELLKKTGYFAALAGLQRQAE